MRLFRAPFLGACLIAATHLSCSADGSDEGAAFNPNADAGSGSDGPSPNLGCNGCFGNTYLPCDDEGKPVAEQPCGIGVCMPGVGCLACIPGKPTCVGQEVHSCDESGSPTAEVLSVCDAETGQTCLDGVCVSECDLLVGSASNVGCEFWPVDLPNERVYSNAVDDPWGLVLTNAGSTTANVRIEINNAPPGQPLQLETVATLTIAQGDLAAIPLPFREVTGWYPGYPDPPGPPMTQLSPFAFRVRSSTPIIAYQFNVFENSYSNDASLLLPTRGLGTQYRVVGFPSSNPFQPPGAPDLPGMPDHANVTIVGTRPDTHVRIVLGHEILGDGFQIPAANAGDVLEFDLGPFTVLNLASRCDNVLCSSDMSGTIVESDKPVAVFSSTEVSTIPWTKDFPTPPGFKKYCCTDHLEEQLFPVTSLGRDFVITRSPPRSTGEYIEADLLRLMGVASPTTVTTSLPAPYTTLTLQPGEILDVPVTADAVMQASEPFSVAQVIVGQAYTTDRIGDPSFTLFPPVEQYRNEYVFLVPKSWTRNTVVIATESGNPITLDGSPLSECEQGQVGSLGAKTYTAIRCELMEGVHTLLGENPFGITVYGYGEAGSYAFAGGADVRRIYEPPPLR